MKLNFIFNMRGFAMILRCTVLILLLLPAAWAQAPTASASLEQRLADLAALVERQQAQIDSLQKSQSELLQQLRSRRADAAAPGTEAASAPTSAALEPAAQPGSAPESSAATSQPAASQSGAAPASASPAEPSELRAANHLDAPGTISLGDRVRIGGYGSLRFETNDVSPGNSIASGSASAFTFRRLVLTTDARPAPRLRIYSEVEFERLFELESEKQALHLPGSLSFKQTLEGNGGGEIALEQAWGQFNFAENHGFRAGVVLVPVGRFNMLHDDDYWDIPRRTLTDRDAPVLPVKSAWRDLGAGLVGSFSVGRTGKLDYQVYGLNGAALDYNLEHEITTTAGSPGTAELVLNSELQLTSGFFDGSKSATAFAWRVAYSPSLHGEFALSGYRGKYAPSFLNFSEPLNAIAYDHKWRWKGFETEAEAVYTRLGNLDRVIESFAAAAFNTASSTLPSSSGGGLASATIEMELANLSRTRYGFWSDFKYHARPAWLKRSFLGKPFEDPQLIPIVRYERVWLNGVTDSVEASGFGDSLLLSFTQEDLSQDRVTAGISFRPAPLFAIQAAYEHNRRLKGSRLIFPAVPDDATNGLILGMSFAF